MTVKLNQPKYSITDEQQARLINASNLGDKIAYEFKSNLEKVIGKIKDQDDKIEDSFGYVLKGLVSTIHYQIKNRDKWNAGIDSKLKNLERMDKEEINRVNTQQMWENKIHNIVVKKFYEPIQMALETVYKDYTGSTWIPYVANDSAPSNVSIMEKKNFDQGMDDYIIKLEDTIENRAS